MWALCTVSPRTGHSHGRKKVLLPQALECQASRRKVPVLVSKMKLDSHEKKAEKGCCEIITVLWNESYATKHRV